VIQSAIPECKSVSESAQVVWLGNPVQHCQVILTPPNRCLDKQLDLSYKTTCAIMSFKGISEIITMWRENMFGLQGIGLPELVIVLVIVLIIFGASRLREIGGALGGAISEFRSSVSEQGGEDEEPAEASKEA
jgi:sec-independent protein translocase protein TatA